MSNQLLLRRRASYISDKRPNYLKFTALEDGCTLALNKVGSPTNYPTEYSLNKGDFIPYVFGTTINFDEGDTIEWRRSEGYESNSFSYNNNHYYAFASTGSISQDGLITTLLSKDLGNITSIEDWAFFKSLSLANNPSLVGTLNIPDGIVRIGGNVFNNCNVFNSINIGADVEHYTRGALMNIGNIDSLTINNAMFTADFGAYYPFNYTYPKDVYYNGTMLQFLQLPDGVYLAGDSNGGVKYNLHLTDRDDSNMNILPYGITKIRECAFLGVKNITGTVYFPDGIETIGSSAFAKTSINGIFNFPSSLVSIGNRAFDSIYISELNLPDGFKSIGNQAFYNQGCANTVFTFPSTLESIGNAAFYGKYGGKYSIFLSSTPPTIVNNLSVPGIVASKKVYVPYSADHSILNAYKTANIWSTFENLIFELDENNNIPID